MSAAAMSADDLLLNLRTDFPFYAERCLKILDKGGKVRPLALNRAQWHLHEKLEAQRTKRGYVRAIGLKGRQQGFSTYVEGRFYWHTSGQFGRRAYILTHEQKATDNLFAMAKRYHEHCPDVVKPSTKTANAKELFFNKLGSGYAVGTAGTKGTGRSSTIQYFHGSEAAWWPNAEEHMAGIGQALPLEPGTESILESTANGIGDLFHRMWQDAVAGENEYLPIFVPWFWQDEYRLPIDDGFVLDADEAQYMEAYGLTPEQMAWRRYKIRNDFQGDVGRFNREYPATPEMAFMSGSEGSYIESALVATCRNTTVVDPVGPLLMGVDPAEYGDDSTAIITRRGRKTYAGERHRHLDPMQVAGIVARKLDADPEVEKACIDVVGIGSGVYARLKEMGFGNRILRVHSGERADEPDLYTNKRAEMYANLKEAMRDQPFDLPDDDLLQQDLTATRFDYDSSRRLRLESKEKMKARGVKSPDMGDALAMTYAHKIQPQHERRIDPRRVARRRLF